MLSIVPEECLDLLHQPLRERGVVILILVVHIEAL